MDQTKISKLFTYCLKAFLVVGTLFYVPFKGPGDPVVQGYMVQELFFRYGVMALFFVRMALKPIRTLNFKSLAVLGIFMIVSCLVYGFGVELRHKLLNVFFGLLFFKLCFENTHLNDLRGFAFWFGWVVLLNLALVALQQNRLDPLMTQIGSISDSTNNMTVGFMRLKVHLGVLAAILAPAVVFLSPAFALALIPLLWFGKSSAAVMAVVLCLIVWAFLNIPRKWFIALSVLLLALGISYVVFFDMPGGQFMERLKVWHATISVSLKTNPWIGNGIGSFARFNFQTTQTVSENLHWTWPHNEFVGAFFEFGVIGFGIIGYFLVSQAKRFKQHMKDPILQVCALSCISILCVSLFHFPMHLARFAPLCIFFFALYSARLEDCAS